MVPAQSDSIRRPPGSVRGRLETSPPPIHILSGGTGSSGLQIVETALAQFPAFRSRIVVRKHVRTMEQAEAVAMEARSDGGVVVHTLVDGSLTRISHQRP